MVKWQLYKAVATQLAKEAGLPAPGKFEREDIIPTLDENREYSYLTYFHTLGDIISIHEGSPPTVVWECYDNVSDDVRKIKNTAGSAGLSIEFKKYWRWNKHEVQTKIMQKTERVELRKYSYEIKGYSLLSPDELVQKIELLDDVSSIKAIVDGDRDSLAFELLDDLCVLYKDYADGRWLPKAAEMFGLKERDTYKKLRERAFVEKLNRTAPVFRSPGTGLIRESMVEIEYAYNEKLSKIAELEKKFVEI